MESCSRVCHGGAFRRLHCAYRGRRTVEVSLLSILRMGGGNSPAPLQSSHARQAEAIANKRLRAHREWLSKCSALNGTFYETLNWLGIHLREMDSLWRRGIVVRGLGAGASAFERLASCRRVFAGKY